MDHVSFNSICKSFEHTINNNPILSLDEEKFIFTKIHQYRNKIFALICRTPEVLAVVHEEGRIALDKEKPYKFFNISVNSTLQSMEEMTKDIASLLEGSSIEMALKKYSIDFNVYEKAFLYWKDHNNKTSSDLYVETFNNLQNYYITKVCNSNVKLLIKIATSFPNIVDTTLTYGDLLNEAFFGMYRAVNLFDISRGNKFSTYASTWVFSTVRRYIDNHGTPVHIPITLSEQKRNVDKIKNKFMNENERTPTLIEIYEQLKKKPENIYTIDHEYRFISIGIGGDQSGDENDGDLESILTDDTKLTSDEAITVKEVKDVVREIIEEIKEANEKYVISNIFGFNKNEEVLSKDEIVNNLQISPKEFDSIKNKTLSRMQDAIMKRRHLRETLDIPSGWSSFCDSEDSW